jgi:hypothetical protein
MRDQSVELLTEQSILFISKHLAGGGVDEYDPLLAVNADDAIHGRVDDPRQALFAYSQCIFRLPSGSQFSVQDNVQERAAHQDEEPAFERLEERDLSGSWYHNE